MLTGVRLFRKEKEGDTLKAVLEELAPPPSAFSPSIGRGLDDIVARALARNVDQRYSTAHEMAGHLEEYLATSGGAVGPSEIRRWLQQILPESLPNLTKLVEATKSGGLARSSVQAL
jgi:serine/threonine protein kinase